MKTLKSMKTYYKIVCLAYIVLASSCKESLDLDLKDPSVSSFLHEGIGEEENIIIKKEFAVALAKALKDSPALRSLIKKKAQEKIDEDYDVLYHLIKEEKLENGVSVRDLIATQYEDKGNLQIIEKKIPTLTIFVPELPNNLFSAETWNVSEQIPRVAVKLTHSNDVPILDAEGSEKLLEAKYIPGFPVVVVKENLRMIHQSHSLFSKARTKARYSTSDGFEFKMLDDAFDRKLNLQKQRGARFISPEVDAKVRAAYNMFSGTNNWQRDYIYYNLTQSQDRGSFDNNFEETITEFSLNPNDAWGCYNRISDQTDDPRLRYDLVESSPYESQNAFWTSSSYTFRFRFTVNGRNGVGSEIIKYVPIPATGLFDVEYTATWRSQWNGYLIRPTNLIVKPYRMNERVFKWNISNYSYAIKCDVEEVDENETTSEQVQTVNKYAVNFGIDFGEEKKIGFKFGANQSQDITNTYTRTVTRGNDPLGDTVIEFGDKVIIDPNGTYTQEYQGGFFRMSFEPTRVQ